MSQQSALDYESALSTVMEFLEIPEDALRVESFDQYQAVVHESGLVEAIGAVMLHHPATQQDANQAWFLRYKMDGTRMSVVAESSELVQTIRTKRSAQAGLQIRHNILLHKGSLSNAGDIAARIVGPKEEMAYTRDGKLRDPRQPEALNSVLQYSHEAIRSFVRLVTA